MSKLLGKILEFIALGGWLLIPIVISITWKLVTEIISIPRMNKNLDLSIKLSEQIPASKIEHFISFYKNKAKQLEPRFNKEPLLQNIPPKNSNDSFWESLMFDGKFYTTEQIIDKYISHEKYSHRRQVEQKLKKCFIPE